MLCLHPQITIEAISQDDLARPLRDAVINTNQRVPEVFRQVDICPINGTMITDQRTVRVHINIGVDMSRAAGSIANFGDGLYPFACYLTGKLYPCDRLNIIAVLKTILPKCERSTPDSEELYPSPKNTNFEPAIPTILNSDYR